nr:GNAT family N-acetyltransferase [Paenibacillus psychroresistens]
MYIGRVSVLPSHRGKGIGKMMVRYIESLAKDNGLSEARLEVRFSVPSNAVFYRETIKGYGRFESMGCRMGSIRRIGSKINK